MKYLLWALTGLAGFALDTLVESAASESTIAESVETESVTESAGTIGRAAWIPRGAHRGGAESMAWSTCLAPAGAFSHPSSASESNAGKAEDRKRASEVRKRCIMPGYKVGMSVLSDGS